MITFAAEDSQNLCGTRLPNSEIQDDQLRAYYDQLDLVNLKHLENEVQKTKTDQFVTIGFRKKVPTAGDKQA